MRMTGNYREFEKYCRTADEVWTSRHSNLNSRVNRLRPYLPSTNIKQHSARISTPPAEHRRKTGKFQKQPAIIKTGRKKAPVAHDIKLITRIFRQQYFSGRPEYSFYNFCCSGTALAPRFVATGRAVLPPACLLPYCFKTSMLLHAWLYRYRDRFRSPWD